MNNRIRKARNEITEFQKVLVIKKKINSELKTK